MSREANHVDADAVRTELREELAELIGNAWERLGDVPGSRWVKIAGALIFGIVLSGGFETRRRRRSR